MAISPSSSTIVSFSLLLDPKRSIFLSPRAPSSMSSKNALQGSEDSSLSAGSNTVKLPSGGGDPSSPFKRSEKQLYSLPEEAAAISHQQIIIRNDIGDRLVGILHDNSGSNTLVVLCHGFRSSKESKTLAGLADALTNEGIGVFRFDFSGNGDSEGSFQYGNYWREVNDLRAVILYFSTQNRQVAAIVGHSKGGNVVLLYASAYQDVSAVVNISGRYDLKRGIEDRLGKDFLQRIRKDGFIDVTDKTGRVVYRVTKESLEDRLNTDVHAACMSIDGNCRVLTIHGSEDEIVPVEDALEISKLVGNQELQIVEGADHNYTRHQSQLAEALVKFVKSNHVQGANILRRASREDEMAVEDDVDEGDTKRIWRSKA